MADNPWDELNESKKSVSSNDEGSAEDILKFFRKDFSSRFH